MENSNLRLSTTACLLGGDLQTNTTHGEVETLSRRCSSACPPNTTTTTRNSSNCSLCQVIFLNRSLEKRRSLQPPVIFAGARLRRMQRTTSYSRLGRSLQAATRSLSTPTSKSCGDDKIVAAVLFERLPVVVPKIDPVVFAFQEFSFRWRQQYRREYPEGFLKKADARGKGDYQIDFTPAPRITDADKSGDKKSLHRALDRRLYLLIYGAAHGSDGKPVWHFPEKAFDSEPTLRKCAESALQSVIGDLSHTYFVGNAPMGHMNVQHSENDSLKRFFFKSQVIATNKFNIRECEDYVWVTKDELLEYFPEQAQYLSKMIIS